MPGATTYECWLTSDRGLRLTPLYNFNFLSATKVVNRIGWFDMKLPDSFDVKYLSPQHLDRMVQIWRCPVGGIKKLWGVYFLRAWEFASEGGQNYVYISGPCIKDILRRRIVAYFAANIRAYSVNDEADDLMKSIVTYAFTDGSAPSPTYGTRVLSDLTVEPNFTRGPQITRAFAWEKLLTSSGGGLLAAIANESKELGTEVFFDVVPNLVTQTAITFTFRTKTGQPGLDVSDQVVFDDKTGTLVNARVGYDASEEETYFYVGGQGEENERNVRQVYDATRIGYSYWGRSEGFTDARDQEENAGLDARGNSDLKNARPRYWFSGTPVDSAHTRFGLHWDVGDRVKAKYKSWEFTPIVRTVSLTVDREREEIDARLEWESGQ